MKNRGFRRIDVFGVALNRRIGKKTPAKRDDAILHVANRENQSSAKPIVILASFRRAELRSPDPTANPYLAYALIILAGLDGQKRKLSLPESVDKNLFECSPEETAGLKTLPLSLEKARKISSESGFLKEVLPVSLLEAYQKTEKDR